MICFPHFSCEQNSEAVLKFRCKWQRPKKVQTAAAAFFLSQAHRSYFEIKQQNLGRPLGKGPSLYKAWRPVGSLGIPEMCMASFVEPY